MDRTDIVRKLFRIESNKDELKLRGFSYTELEFTDLMDMVAILDNGIMNFTHSTKELIEIL